MSDDSLLAAVSGVTGGIRDVLVPYLQTRYKSQVDTEQRRALMAEEREGKKIKVSKALASQLGLEEGSLVDPTEITALSGLKKPEITAESRRMEVDPQVAAKLGLVGKPSLTSSELAAVSKLEGQKAAVDRFSERKETERLAGLKKSFPKAKGSYDSAILGYDTMIRLAKLIKNDPALGSATGGTFGIKGKLNFTEGQRRVDANIQTLQSKGLLNVIQGLKELSATGATGFGPLSQSEGELLKASIANLKRTLGTKDFKKQVDALIEQAESSKGIVNRQFKTSYGDFLSGAGGRVGSPNVGGSGGLTPEEAAELAELEREFGGE